jgi:hypothetical protein
VLETFISRVNNNHKLVYGCEFHDLPSGGPTCSLLPCGLEHREAGLAAGTGGTTPRQVENLVSSPGPGCQAERGGVWLPGGTFGR